MVDIDMRIGGVDVTHGEEVLVLPRTLGDDIVFRAVAVDVDDYEENNPKPEPPVKVVRGGRVQDVHNVDYIKSVQGWGARRFDWIVINSLLPSNIEWDTVDLEDRKTWGSWQDDLGDAGLSGTECNRVITCVLNANSLNEAKLREAQEFFLRGLAEPLPKSSTDPTEPPTSPSGPPANDGE